MQECSPSVVHDEITIDNSDSEQEAEKGVEADYVKVENEKNIVKTYENVLKSSPKVNNISDSNRSNNNLFKVNTPVLTLRPKPTEWQIVTHIKLNRDVKVCPLHVDFKENVNLNKFYGFSEPSMDSKGVFQNMMSLYNAWRTDFNNINAYNKVEERNEKVVNVQSQPEEIIPEVEEMIRERTPDINDSKDFPTLCKCSIQLGGAGYSWNTFFCVAP